MGGDSADELLEEEDYPEFVGRLGRGELLEDLEGDGGFGRRSCHILENYESGTN